MDSLLSPLALGSKELESEVEKLMEIRVGSASQSAHGYPPDLGLRWTRL